MNALGMIITNAGFAEIVNAEASGTAPVRLTGVGLGRGQYQASPEQTGLVDEFYRLSTVWGGVTDSGIIHVSAIDDMPHDYEVFEVGIFTDTGVLFAVYSQTTPIMQKVADSDAMLAFDCVLTNANPESVTLGDTNFALAPADKNRAGVVELATAEEVLAATDDLRAITPAALLGAVPGGRPTEQTGWQRLPSGLIIQWGHAMIAANTGTTVVLPTAYRNACRVAVATPEAGTPVTVYTVSKDRGNVLFQHNGNGAVSIDWIALGD